MTRAGWACPLLLMLFLSTLPVFTRPLSAQDALGPGLLRGTVVDDTGSLVPRVHVTATNLETGVRRAALAGPQGTFIIPMLPPGRYIVTAERPGFATVEVRGVLLRRAEQLLVRIRLKVAPLRQSITVSASRSLLGRLVGGASELLSVAPTTTLGARFTAENLAILPNTRNYVDAIETAAGINDRAAFGAGGNVEAYDVFAWGAATNSYQLNGLPANNIEFGNAWVNPNYDAIEEIQVIGPGATAEYANFTGASINVITKAGTDEFRGGASAWYTSRSLIGDNSGSIADYLSPIVKYKVESSVYVGGPAIPDRLLFFGSFGYNPSSSAPHKDPTTPTGTPDFYDRLRRNTYQARVDLQLHENHRLTGMYDGEPILDRDLGLQPGAGSAVGYWRDWTSDTALLSWQGTWSGRTVSEVKFGTLSGHQYRVPNARPEIPAVFDLRRGNRQYGSTGFRRDQENARHHLMASVTHYTEEFLRARHEFKAGAEYGHARALTSQQTSGNVMFYLYPYSPGLTYAWALTGYNRHQSTKVSRLSGYVQDRIEPTHRAAITLGVRYDGPSFTDLNTGKRLMSFNNVALRSGVSYDLTGDGRAVIRAAGGRYYEKIPTFGPAQYAGTGNTPVSYYRLLTRQPIDPSDWRALQALLIQPANLFETFATSSKPVDPAIRNPKTDAINVGLETQTGRTTALSLTYLYKRSDDYISLATRGDLKFASYRYAHPFNGRALQLYNWTNQDVPRDDLLANIGYFYQRNHLAIAELRARPHPRFSLNTSLTWEHSSGTRENNECAILSLCTNGRDKDPNYVDNPWQAGLLMANRTWQFKLTGTATLPGRVTATWDYRRLSGHPWGATDRGLGIPGFTDRTHTEVRLEPKDARRKDPVSLMNLRLSKSFTIGRAEASALIDVLNVFNTSSPAGTFFHSNIGDRFTYTLDTSGEPARAFGKPVAIESPRQVELGLRLTF